MRKKTISKIFLILFLFSSCAVKVKQENDVVDLFDPNSKDNKIKVNEAEKSNSNVYGPTHNEDHKYKTKLPKDAVVGVVLLPALYSSIKYIGLLDELNRQKLNVRVISSVGMGSIISSIYSQKQSSSQVEWFFYKNEKKLKNSQVYSKAWQKEVSRLVSKTFKDTKIEKQKVNLLVPVYDHRKDKVVFPIKGFVRDLVLSNLNLSDRDKPLMSPMLKDFDLVKPVTELGVDTVIIANALGDELKLQKESDYLMGLFGKVISNNIYMDVLDVIYIDLSEESDKNDSINNITQLINSGRKISKKFLSDIKLKMKQSSN